MKKIEIKTKIVGGNFKRNRPLIKKAIQSMEGKEVYITIRKATKQRSNNQNAYYWGVIIPISQNAIADVWGEIWSKEKTHDFFKIQFCFEEKINESTGEIIKSPKSTTEQTTTQMEEYHEQIRQFMQEWFNVQIPLPNEEIELFKN